MSGVEAFEQEIRDHQLMVMSDTGDILGWWLYHPKMKMRVEIVFTPVSCFLAMGRSDPFPTWRGSMHLTQFLNATEQELLQAFISDDPDPDMLAAIRIIRDTFKVKFEELYDPATIRLKLGARISRVVR